MDIASAVAIIAALAVIAAAAYFVFRKKTDPDETNDSKDKDKAKDKEGEEEEEEDEEEDATDSGPPSNPDGGAQDKDSGAGVTTTREPITPASNDDDDDGSKLKLSETATSVNIGVAVPMGASQIRATLNKAFADAGSQLKVGVYYSQPGLSNGMWYINSSQVPAFVRAVIRAAGGKDYKFVNFAPSCGFVWNSDGTTAQSPRVLFAATANTPEACVTLDM